MSDMERNKGVLTPCSKEEVLSRYPDCDLNDLDYDTHGAYMRLKDSFFRVQWEVRADSGGGFCDVGQHPNGFIQFHTYHYNGGGSLEEVLEYSLTAVTIENK